MRYLGFILMMMAGVVSTPASTLEIEDAVVVRAGETQILPLPLDDLSPSPIDQVKRVHIKEVHLGKDASILFPPFRSIQIERLVSQEGSKIQLIHSGGASRFFINQISGHIVLESRGADGIDGRDGRHGRQGQDGERGRNARSLLFGLIWLGDGERGRAGYPGENGEDGESGGNGENGGEITLYYKEKNSDSKILIDVSGGAAGRAGLGGLGGLGGNGGMGGKGWKKGSQGPMGVSGQAGKSGRPGKPGLPGKASIYQLPHHLHQCLMELDARSLFENLQDEDYEFCRLMVLPGRQDFKSKDIIVQSTQPYEYSEENGEIWIGSDGANGKSGVAASSGASGGKMTLFFRSVPEKVFLSARGGNGGNGADGLTGPRGADGKNGKDGGLFHKATPGVDGQDGLNGGHGSDGASGGSGGSIRVIRLLDSGEDDPHWVDRFSYAIAGGQAGRGGKAAAGGRGGLGGQGGKKFLSSKREADGRPGRDGIAGEDGRDGEDGERGRIEFFEVYSLTDWIIEEFRTETERLKSH